MSASTGPRHGEAVYDQSRANRTEKDADGYLIHQPNGYIRNILWDDGHREIIVYFYGRDTEVYDWDDFIDCWVEAFGGVWWLN